MPPRDEMLAGPDPFSELRETTGLMSGFGKPWLVAGGWALDLYVGRSTRRHNDVDLAIFREDQADFEAVRTALDDERRTWLKRALEVDAPGHTWLDRL